MKVIFSKMSENETKMEFYDKMICRALFIAVVILIFAVNVYLIFKVSKFYDLANAQDVKELKQIMDER